MVVSFVKKGSVTLEWKDLMGKIDVFSNFQTLYSL